MDTPLDSNICQRHGKPIRAANLNKKHPNKTTGCQECRANSPSRIRDNKRAGLKWAYKRAITRRIKYFGGDLRGFELFERVTGFKLQETNG